MFLKNTATLSAKSKHTKSGKSHWQDMINICKTSFTCQLANAVSVDFSWLAAIVVDKVRTQKVENHRGSYLENIELFSNFYDFKLKSMNFRHLIMNVQKIG